MKALAKKGLPKLTIVKNSAVLSNVLTNIGLSAPSARLTELTDEALVKRFKRGDENAFSALLARHKNPVFNFLFKYLGSEENAEEAFQEVFLRVIRSLDEYRTQAKFTTWLYTIARNYCIDESRKARFRNHLSLSQGFAEDNKETWQDRVASNDENSEQLLQASEVTGHLQEVLGRINPHQREVFLLREVQDLSFDEIGQITGVSTNTVKSRMRYAVQAIQRELTPVLGEGEGL